MTARQVTEYLCRSKKIKKPLRLAVASDLHGGPYEDVLPEIKRCDAVLIPGDLVNRHRPETTRALNFLRDAARLAPTFYALGNHEWKFDGPKDYWQQVRATGAVVLENRWTRFEGLVLGGLSAAPDAEPEDNVAADMARQAGFRLLLCHQPEWYERHVKPYDIDLTVAGHAHGGQVRLFGQGLFAPGQGFFPKLTSGFYDGGRLLVSRGMTNSAGVPRLWNPCELIILRLIPEEE